MGVTWCCLVGLEGPRIEGVGGALEPDRPLMMNSSEGLCLPGKRHWFTAFLLWKAGLGGTKTEGAPVGQAE